MKSEKTWEAEDYYPPLIITDDKTTIPSIGVVLRGSCTRLEGEEVDPAGALGSTLVIRIKDNPCLSSPIHICHRGSILYPHHHTMILLAPKLLAGPHQCINHHQISEMTPSSV